MLPSEAPFVAWLMLPMLTSNTTGYQNRSDFFESISRGRAKLNWVMHRLMYVHIDGEQRNDSVCSW
jgi:hypothetical protein